jgi:hypothetical protein
MSLDMWAGTRWDEYTYGREYEEVVDLKKKK